MELCLLLQFPSPEHMHATLTRGQVARWYQFMAQVPVGERREDLRLAHLVAHVRAMQGAKDQRPSDFLLDFYPPEVDTRSPVQKLGAYLKSLR